MPLNEPFWNPYRLVPAKEVRDRQPPKTHERFDGHCGIISCTLENLTPLFIWNSRPETDRNFLKRNGSFVIPGSSLKGMFRSLAELVGGGCFSVSSKRGMNNSPPTPVPKEMAKCDDIHRLCITCRMFGAMEEKANARVHMGKVGISDAIWQGPPNARCQPFEVYLSGCGVRHEPFYRSPHTGQLDGKSRKLYFHQPMHQTSIQSIPAQIRKQAWRVHALPAGQQFRFEVQFTNLTDSELSLLLYIIALEKTVDVRIDHSIRLRGPMRHKIGNAKPLGMGSCAIHIERLTYLAPPQERFSALRHTSRHILEKDSLKKEIEIRIQPYVTDRSPTMEGVRKMMVWDELDKRIFRYPDYTWFQNSDNKKVPLKNL